jgi:ATP-binding cassette subfamily C protein
MSGPRRVHTPTVLQLEAVECGAASLGIILAYFGRFVPLAELRQKCGVSRDGSKASKVVLAARAYGLQAKGFSKDLEGLKALAPPFIVFWQFDHFLVVEGMTDRVVYLNDPANGHRTVTLEEFNYAFTGVVLWMAPGPEFRPGGARARLLPAILTRLRRHAAPVAFCFGAGVLLTLPRLLLPVCGGLFIDQVLIQGHRSWFRPLLAAMAAAALVQLGLKLLETTALRRLRLALMAQFSSQFFWHLLRLPMAFYAQRFSGEISYRARINHAVAEVLSGRLASTGIALVSMGFYVLVMAFYSPLLTGIGVGFAAVNFFALRALYRRRVEARLRMSQDEGKAAGLAIAGIQGIETLKASGMESGFFAKWAGYYSKSAMAQQELESSTLALGVLPVLLEGLTLTLVLSVGGWEVLDGHLTIGNLVAFSMMMLAFLQPVSELVNLCGTLQELEADLLRLDDVLANPVATDRRIGFRSCQGEETGSESYPTADGGAVRLQGELEVRDLTFGYSPLDPPLIKGLSFHVRPGQRVALVGGSGSGKSTIARVVAGLYEPWGGEVRFDGRCRQELPRPLLDNSIGLVDQDVLLFEGTVRENLSLWDETVSQEALVRACRDAAIADVVFALPGGLDAPLEEGGTNLSGGQRQRLEIARALSGNPSVLILDEATSALDPETEFAVAESIRRRGCTCLIVAHRLSTIRDCDEIIVLQRGEVVERGTHEQLWEKQGQYARLIRTEEH